MLDSNSKNIIHLFDPPYEIWSERLMTKEEMLDYMKQAGHFAMTVKDKQLGTIATPLEAAKHMVAHAVDEKLNSHLEDRINSSATHVAWRRLMPGKTPTSIAKYQKNFPHYDSNAVDHAISQLDFCLPVGQELFHGGVWPDPSSASFITDRPLSTTLLPSVALRNAEYRGKAYHHGEIHLMVLTIKDPEIRSFIFRKSGALLGHEYEVLIPSGIKLNIRNKIYVRNDYPSSLDENNKKLIPGAVLEIDVG